MSRPQTRRANDNSTTLTINLFNGSSISGAVTDGTEVECEAPGGQVDPIDSLA